jgi:hypothetical protein
LSINENQKIELFEDFYAWLKKDGLKAKKSERLHKKKIFASLLANDAMTLENFKDFLEDKSKNAYKELVGLEISFCNDVHRILKIEDVKQGFKLICEGIHVTCKHEDFESVKKRVIYPS